jgi:hypothetical protein
MENVMGLIDNRDAQFMLLAGFIIALGLVITTILFNNIIFQGNMAGEAGSDPSKYEIVNLMQITADEMKNAYNYSNGTNNTLKSVNFSRQMQNFSASLSTIYALHGGGVSGSWDISNWNSTPPRYANFTKNGMAGGAPNWTVIESVNNATIFVNITAITTPFNISIINATKTWQINFTSLGNRTVNNSQIKFNITSAYNISFVNGANVTGNYSITGNTTYGRAFIRARDYILNATVTFSTSGMRATITIPVSVPW